MNESRILWIVVALVIAFFAAAAVWRGGADDRRQARADERVEIVLRFVTTRERNADAKPDKPGEALGGDRGPTAMGLCRVSSTPIPITEALAKRADFYVPTRDREITAVDTIAADRFWDDLETAAAAKPDAPIVLFVHGYFYGFERVCLRGAGLQQALADRGHLVMFTWPSDGNPAGYVADQADVEWSVPQLADLVRELSARFGADRLRLVAHSLGTRGMLFALSRILLEGGSGPLASQLVLLAPDFDAQSFLANLPLVAPLVGDITVYASDNDRPLKVSEELHGQPRLGQGGDHRTVAAGFETVDVSDLGRYQYSGHEYFHYHPVASADLVSLLVSGARAAERPHTVAHEVGGLSYWTLSDPD
jgi:esterase/lipase superfamily enzyme